MKSTASFNQTPGNSSGAGFNGDDAAVAAAASRHGTYRAIWRWHFYAGLFCIPLLITLAVSGAIYLFKPQLDAWVDAPFQDLPVDDKRHSAYAQIEAALAAVPGAVFKAYQLPEHKRQAVVVHLAEKGERTLVYLNPYDLEILKVIAYEDQFIRQVRTFHGELLAGNTGSVIVELAACWAIVLIITGLYLWWPRSAKGMAGIVYPRFGQGKRALWRDLHAVTGFWIAAMVLFLLISGLPWSLVWGGAFKELRQWNKPVVQDWSLGRAQEKQAALSATQNKTGVLKPVLSETLLESAVNLNFAPPVLLSVSRKDPNVWTVKSRHQNRPLRSDAWLSASGEIHRVQPFSQRPLIDRIVGIGVAAHEGQLFGWFNQFLGVVCAIGLVVLSVSAFILWRRRKPQGALGAPKVLPNMKAGRAVWIITIVLAAVLPLLAVSLMTILLLEKILLQRFESTRRWLGLEA